MRLLRGPAPPFKDLDTAKGFLRGSHSWGEVGFHFFNFLVNCDMLQSVHNVEYDPNTDYLWIIDTGENSGLNICKPKLVIWDIINNIEVYRWYISLKFLLLLFLQLPQILQV